MFIPSKYENLNHSVIVIGAQIILCLRDKPLNIEILLKKIRITSEVEISLSRFYDAMTFLWLLNSIVYDTNTYIVKINKL